MTINIARLRQFSVGIIFFSILMIVFLVLGILGSLHYFLQEGTIYDFLNNPSGYWIVDPNLNTYYNYSISIYILASSFSMLVIVFCFWLFFAIKNLQVSKLIDSQIKSDLKKLSIINFFTLFIGSISQLATCDEIIEKYRTLKSEENYENKIEKEV